jgi:hypothetical protein
MKNEGNTERTNARLDLAQPGLSGSCDHEVATDIRMNIATSYGAPITLCALLLRGQYRKGSEPCQEGRGDMTREAKSALSVLRMEGHAEFTPTQPGS